MSQLTVQSNFKKTKLLNVISDTDGKGTPKLNNTIDLKNIKYILYNSKVSDKYFTK